MSRMKCNSIKSEYNRLLFKVKQTPGDRRVLRTSGGIYTRPIPEGYYMNRGVKKSNPIVNMFKRMYTELKDIITTIAPAKNKPIEDVTNYKGSTTEI